MAEASCECVNNEASLIKEMTTYENIVVKLKDSHFSWRIASVYENVYSSKTNAACIGTDAVQIVEKKVQQVSDLSK